MKMNSAQEKLVKTYFRKRGIASEATYLRSYKYQPYEVKYLIANKDKYNTESIRFSDNVVLDDIIKHPEKISSYNFQKNDTRLDYDFDALMVYYPELSKLFTMDAVNKHHRGQILRIYPQRVTELTKDDLDNLADYDKAELIIRHPAFEKYFPLQNFEDRFIKKILAKHPEFVKKIDLSKFRYYDITPMIERNPKILKYFNVYELKDSDEIISGVLSKLPELIDYFDSNALKTLTDYQISNIIIKQPQLVDRFDLSKFNVHNISYLLSKQPGFAKYFDLDKLGEYDKPVLVRSHPEYLPILDIDNTSAYMLLYILEEQPQLVNKFIGSKDRWGEDKFARTDKKNIKTLLKAQPQLKPYFEKYLKQQ
jgi:hypothetical protein